MSPVSRISLAALALALSAPAFAQAGPASDASEPQEDHPSEDHDIIVTGALRVSRQDALSGVAVVSGEELAASQRSSLGETLARIPGVSATSFGPSASRPVLRGLQGERVRVLSNGLGAIDVSNTSADHAPAINPLLAQRIEVLRGPQSLQYGSAAIGGVVNVIDRRIPTVAPDEPIHLAAQAGFASAAREVSLATSMEIPLGSGWVAHADGSWFDSDDLRIGGYALTPALRAEAIASSLLPPEPDADAAIDFAANAALRGSLPNTASRSWNAGAGIAYIGEGGNIGVAYSHLENRYGVPVRFATLPGQEQEAPTLQMRQDRIDARAEIAAGGALIDRISLRYAFADYQHAEIEPDGTVGTVFLTTGTEGRFELAQAERGGWSGASGVQWVSRDFNVIGAEAFLPRNTTSQFGLFSVQQLQRGPLRIELGGRYEFTRHVAQPGLDQPQFFAGARSFATFSGSLGAAYELDPALKFGVNLSRSERAPSAEELFANGAHKGTATFEIGDPGLGKESAWSAEAILRHHSDGLTLEASAYHSWFGGFVYEARTGAQAEGLPVFAMNQADARLYGFEVLTEATLAKPGVWTISADAMADYVHTTITGEGPAPRIPPMRIAGGLTAHSPHLELRADIEHGFAQNRTAAFETTTPAYTLVNAALTWRPWGNARPLSVSLSGNNLFNVVARRHASFLKDYAPLAGRDVRLTVRLEI